MNEKVLSKLYRPTKRASRSRFARRGERLDGWGLLLRGGRSLQAFREAWLWVFLASKQSPRPPQRHAGRWQTVGLAMNCGG